MSDYKRLVSYIYSYPGGVREKNVGFAKAEVRGGQFKLYISLKGVYTDAPENFGVYLMFDRDTQIEGRYTLFPIGSFTINNGMGQYNDLLNPENINSSGYAFSDINGIAVARKDNRYYMMFSLWEDGTVTPDSVNFVEHDYKKLGVLPTSIRNIMEDNKAISINKDESVTQISEVTTEDLTDENPVQQVSQIAELLSQDKSEIKAASAEPLQYYEQPEQSVKEPIQKPNSHEKIFQNAEFIDAFDDDYYYDCIEVSPEQLRDFIRGDDTIISNSFLLHGYYNFRHILFGRVRPNNSHTAYFIGVPGMYCNRERFMASMFGFNSFKKSCRSDYSNPYFGYWYQEI